MEVSETIINYYTLTQQITQVNNLPEDSEIDSNTENIAQFLQRLVLFIFTFPKFYNSMKNYYRSLKNYTLLTRSSKMLQANDKIDAILRNY